MIILKKKIQNLKILNALCSRNGTMSSLDTHGLHLSTKYIKKNLTSILNIN